MSDAVTVKKLLAFALQRGASDLHLSSGLSPLIRLHGEMTRLDVPVISAEAMITMAATIPVMPVTAPANEARASWGAEPATADSALPRTLRIIPAKCKNTKPASSIANAPMRLFH